MPEKVRNLRRTLSDLLVSACALTVLFALLVTFDKGLRDEIVLRMDRAQASVEIASAQSQTGRLYAAVVGVAKEQTQQHGPLVIFLVVAGVLTVFMVRI